MRKCRDNDGKRNQSFQAPIKHFSIISFNLYNKSANNVLYYFSKVIVGVNDFYHDFKKKGKFSLWKL